MSLKQPVQYPVKYYSHADADAPQLADADGVIKTILKACLITGYGAKEGAGWTSLFEDAFRIVLRRPLGTGNPPDIKIENGVINGTASHRIVSQEDPTGIDDTTELAAVNLLARDNFHGIEWHLVACDFGFIFCYQMGEYDQNLARSTVLYCSSNKKISEKDAEQFIVSANTKVGVNGRAVPWMSTFFDVNTQFKDMRTGLSDQTLNYLSINIAEDAIGGDYAAQPLMLGVSGFLSFYTSISSQWADTITSTVSIDGRPMLRYVNKPMPVFDKARVLYIPLDYWEL